MTTVHTFTTTRLVAPRQRTTGPNMRGIYARSRREPVRQFLSDFETEPGDQPTAWHVLQTRRA